jgi:hypothetical protein
MRDYFGGSSSSRSRSFVSFHDLCFPSLLYKEKNLALQLMGPLANITQGFDD